MGFFNNSDGYQEEGNGEQQRPSYQNNGGFQKKPWQQNGGGGGGFNKGNFVKKEVDLTNLKLYKPYVITGNAAAPKEIMEQMKRIATELEEFGYTIRTGGMEGPDDYLENCVKDNELYIPWKKFNKKPEEITKLYFNSPESLAIAKMFHPTFDGLHFSVQAFLAKNARMVLGDKLKSPAMFIICWSEDAIESGLLRTARTGNMGHVLAIAQAMKIPVFNLAKPDAEQRLKKYLDIPYVEKQAIEEI